jgi:hypothetical protein
MRFECDPVKARLNIARHGIAFSEAITATSNEALIPAPSALGRRHDMNDERTEMAPDPDLTREHDFSGGVRGTYLVAYQNARVTVALETDVAARFPDAASVNRALRDVIAREDQDDSAD